MTDNAIRIPKGIRAVSDKGLAELLGAVRETRSGKVADAILAPLAAEADRRANPMEIEPEWPKFDVATWTTDELFIGIRECLSIGTVLDDPAARAFIRTLGFICWSTFRYRTGITINEP